MEEEQLPAPGNGDASAFAQNLTFHGERFQCRCPTCEEERDAEEEDGGGDRVDKPPWRKVLYISQPYADNHTDADTFLQHMVMNADVSTPSYWPTVEASLVVAHEVATVALVVAVFAFFFNGVLSSTSLYSLNFSFLVGGLMLAALAEAEVATSPGVQVQHQGARGEPSGQLGEMRREVAPESISRGTRTGGDVSEQAKGGTVQMNKPMQDGGSWAMTKIPAAVARCWNVVSTCALIGVYMQLLSPILHTLTGSISSDTIWCSTAYLLLLHLFFHDYSYSAALSPAFSSYLALLSALFACVLLASRLPSPDHAFLFVAFGLQSFGLLPGILNRVAQASERSHRVVVLLLLVLSVLLVFNLSQLIGFVLVSILLFVVLVCPGILVFLHKSYKSRIQGPWDEAKLPMSFSQ